MLPVKISLIGMPSSGKSTIAKALSEKIGYLYMDLDYMVEEKEGMSLIEVMEKKGPQYFRDMEYGFLQMLPDNEKVVVSTPGSSIYHEPMMQWLKAHTFIICIEEEISAIEERLVHTPKAISDLKEKGLERLWQERMPVYKKWADMCIKINGRSVSDIVEECIVKLNK
jgi:shikimate kinase